ncbi:MAG: hypothetical protein KIS96_06705 [Bauldia sp.]|nr:hypothetical protein [Bauldia sp.]
MKLARLLVTGLAVAGLCAGAALADNPPPPAVDAVPSGSAFDGAYFGSFAVRSTFFSLTRPGAGVQYGYNFTSGNFLFGVEVEQYHLSSQWVVDGSINGRIGLLIGDRGLVYGQYGVGTVSGNILWIAGGGLEIAVNDRLSTFVEASTHRSFSSGSHVGRDVHAGIIIRPGDKHPGADEAAASGGHPWHGLYLGVSGGFASGYSAGSFGVRSGFNFGGDRFVAGIEYDLTQYDDFWPLINGSANLRGGVVLADRVLLYGTIGAGAYTGTPSWTAGGGLERSGSGGNTSLFLDAKSLFPIFGGDPRLQITAGVNLHFGH